MLDHPREDDATIDSFIMTQNAEQILTFSIALIIIHTMNQVG